MSDEILWTDHEASHLRARLARPTVLVTIDVQGLFVAQGGWFHRMGFDVAPLQAVVPRIGQLQEEVRANGLHQVHVGTVDDRWRNWPQHIIAPRLLARLEAMAAPEVESPRDPCAFLPRVMPAPEDAVVSKHAHDAFSGTSLAFVLRKMKCETLLLGGVTTRGCVEATARSAFAHGFAVVVVRDAVADHSAEMHQAALHFMAENIGIVATMAQVRAAAGWSSAPGPAGGHGLRSRS